MNIVLITQNQPFYIKDAVEHLTQDLPENVKITGCVLGDVSPFGKKEKFYKKAFNTLKIFGIKFFSIYALKYLLSKFKSYYGLKSAEKKLCNLVDDFDFVSISQADSSLDWDSARVVNLGDIS